MPPRRRRPPRPGALTDLAPLRILRQIILLQLAYYMTAIVLLVFTVLAAGKHMSVDLLLGWESLRGDITEGWMLGLVWMLNSLISVVFILLLIARSKLVPDFAITIHFIHLIVTSVYSRSVPTYFFWWGVQVASTVLMIFLGIWSCQWRELQPVFFGGKGEAASDGAVAGSALDGPGIQGVVEHGLGIKFGKGTGKSKGANDGHGSYEMISAPQGQG